MNVMKRINAIQCVKNNGRLELPRDFQSIELMVNMKKPISMQIYK